MLGCQSGVREADASMESVGLQLCSGPYSGAVVLTTNLQGGRCCVRSGCGAGGAEAVWVDAGGVSWADRPPYG